MAAVDAHAEVVPGGDEFVAFYGTGARVVGEFRCSDCGYGIVPRGAVPICPMCRGSSWEASLWRPFTRSGEPR